MIKWPNMLPRLPGLSISRRSAKAEAGLRLFRTEKSAFLSVVKIPGRSSWSVLTRPNPTEKITFQEVLQALTTNQRQATDLDQIFSSQ